MLFKSVNLTINNYDFLKRFGTLYDFLIDLLSEKISFKKSALEQKQMVNKILELKDFVLLEEKNIDKETRKGVIKKLKTKALKKKYFDTKKCFK